MEIESLLKLILSKDELEEYAFGGDCFSMAFALHELCPQSKIKLSCNKALYEYNRYVGHCAIELEGYYIDGNGTINPDEFLSWGMLADDDESYIEDTKISMKAWKTLAYEAQIVELSVDQLRNIVDMSVVEKIRKILSS